MNNFMDPESGMVSHKLDSRSKALRIAGVIACSLALIAVAALVSRNAEITAGKQELFWGGPLSFDMVHTHILNMKMRRSRLKERLKEQALKRKDQELAHEHGFNNQGALQANAAPPEPEMAPNQGMAQPPQQPQMYQQPPQPQYQEMPQAPPQYAPPQPEYAQPPQGYAQAPQQFQPQQMAQPPQYYPQQQQQMSQYEQAPQDAPQLAMYSQATPAASNPWGGQTYNANSYQQVPVNGPTESSNEDKDQQRAQAAASITAYEAFMHGAPPAK